MKVAFDAGPRESRSTERGIGMYSKGLINELEKIHSVQVELIDAKVDDLSKYDVVHYPWFPVHTVTLPPKFSRKSVVTIHDMIYLLYPKAYPLGIKGRLKFLQQKHRLRNVDAIIAVSETSKKDIIRFLDVDPSRIYVVHNGPQKIKETNSIQLIKLTKEKFALPDTFVLYVGDVNYNKNLVRLADACKLANVTLVIVGKQAVADFDRNHPENRTWGEFLRKYESDTDIIRLGFLENDEFAAVWRLASVYCQASLYEGFGMPILEAFGQGVPVVAAKTQALVEVGANACLYVDPYNVKSISKGLSEVLGNKKLQKDLVQKGSIRLQDFSWKKAAHETLAVYQQVTSK
jgi:glycosyltransferase involved in cell wall biosynthesis